MCVLLLHGKSPFGLQGWFFPPLRQGVVELPSLSQSPGSPDFTPGRSHPESPFILGLSSLFLKTKDEPSMQHSQCDCLIITVQLQLLINNWKKKIAKFGSNLETSNLEGPKSQRACCQPDLSAGGTAGELGGQQAGPAIRRHCGCTHITPQGEVAHAINSVENLYQKWSNLSHRDSKGADALGCCGPGFSSCSRKQKSHLGLVGCAPFLGRKAPVFRKWWKCPVCTSWIGSCQYPKQSYKCDISLSSLLCNKPLRHTECEQYVHFSFVSIYTAVVSPDTPHKNYINIGTSQRPANEKWHSHALPGQSWLILSWCSSLWKCGLTL